MKKGHLDKVIRYLSIQNPAPIFKEGTKWFRTATHFKMDTDKIKFLTNQRKSEFFQLQEYMHTKKCLMSFLREALNDNKIVTCGRCKNCDPQNTLDESFSQKNGIKASKFLKHHEMPIEARKQFSKDAFLIYQFKTKIPEDLRAEEGRVLSKWEDAGWGKLVAEGKRNNHFSDELVDAMAEMIARWNPKQHPTWITCVPSLRHTTLVPDFTQRLAKKLNIPYYEVVTKVTKNSPQKMMQNSYYQCQNLDGAFSIDNIQTTEAVFLVDDIVDSRWTFTVIAALLRRTGVKAVLPIALTSTANN
jgi:ATP-dependent DNA helicase RecQ